jgi:hypothetical protein
MEKLMIFRTLGVLGLGLFAFGILSMLVAVWLEPFAYLVTGLRRRTWRA